jgi:predicted small metal-binding protein
MTKSISCSDAGKDCKWSASASTEEELMEKVTQHVQNKHKEIELDSESISSIKSLIKDI